MNQGLTAGIIILLVIMILKPPGFAVPDGVRIISCNALSVKQITQIMQIKQQKKRQKKKPPLMVRQHPGADYDN